jgi:hypothetical protein
MMSMGAPSLYPLMCHLLFPSFQDMTTDDTLYWILGVLVKAVDEMGNEANAFCEVLFIRIFNGKPKCTPTLSKLLARKRVAPGLMLSKKGKLDAGVQ